jgi:hypothetical protein
MKRLIYCFATMLMLATGTQLRAEDIDIYTSPSARS